jgi:protein LSM14
MPAVPLPTALTAKATQPTQNVPSKATQEASASALRDATLAAKAAVAVAMAKMNAPGSSQQANGSGMENLTKKVNEMRVNAPRGDAPRGGAHTRGGRGRGPRPAKVEVPDADFDFASSNAKFNKEEIVKEAIASGSPLGETVPNGGAITPDNVLDSVPGSGALPAYNKTKSFFDNISSEAKDRAENNGQKPGGREWRGEEQRKNMETFGQGSVDGGYRGGYRGRGRGRGGRGRGFGRGAGVRGGGPYRSNRETQSAS